MINKNLFIQNINDCTTVLQQLRVCIEQMKANIDSYNELEHLVNTLEENVDDIETDITDNIKPSITANANDITDIKGDIQDIQDDITFIKNDMSVKLVMYQYTNVIPSSYGQETFTGVVSTIISTENDESSDDLEKYVTSVVGSFATQNVTYYIDYYLIKQTVNHIWYVEATGHSLQGTTATTDIYLSYGTQVYSKKLQ